MWFPWTGQDWVRVYKMLLGLQNRPSMEAAPLSVTCIDSKSYESFPLICDAYVPTPYRRYLRKSFLHAFLGTEMSWFNLCGQQEVFFHFSLSR